MKFYIDNAITLDTIIDGNSKTLRDLANENRLTAKSYVFDNIRDGLLPDDETLNELGIKRIIHKPTFTNVLFDKTVVKDNKVYPKETMKLSTILKELNTIERTADKIVTEE